MCEIIVLMEKKIGLNVLGVSASSDADSATLILSECDGNRRLAIKIGIPEAQSIAVCLEGVATPRPLVHDLFLSFSESFGVAVSEVVIYDIQNGIFCSKIVCDREGNVSELDARTSDAIAIALRFNCPIFISEGLLQTSCLPVGAPKSKVSLEECSIETLQEMMDEAVRSENYELASRIRDIINSRQ